MAVTERELNILIKAKDMASKVLEKYEDQFNQIGKVVAAAGAAGAAGLGAAVKVTADFESAMSRVGALSQASDKDLTTLTQTAKDLGASTAFSASQAAEGMSFLAMAGFDVNETISAMPGLLATAAAGQTDLGTTADIVSNILSGFAIKAEETGRVADVLSKAFTTSNTDLNMLGETMKFVAPVATAAGLSLEEMAAAAGLMGNAGIQGSMAGTALRGMIMRLQAPTDAAAAMIQKLGLELRNMDGTMKSLPEILAEFENGLAGVTKEEQDMALKSIIGMEAMAGFQALLNEGSGKLKDYTGELQNAGGTAGKIADQQLDNLNGALTILKSGLEGAAIAIGSNFTPYLKMAAEFVTTLVERFNALDPEIQRKISLALALGSALALLTGGILILIPMLPALKAAFFALLGPVGLVIAAVLGLAYAFATNLGGIRDKIMGWIQPVIDAFKYFTGGFDETLAKAGIFGEGMETIFSDKTLAIINLVNTLRTKILEIWTAIKETVIPILIDLGENLVGLWNKYGDQILANIMTHWGNIKTVFFAALDAVVALIEWAFPHIQNIIKFVMDNIAPFLIETWQKISQFIQEILPPLIEAIRSAWEGFIEPMLTNVMKRLMPFLEKAWNFISTIISGALDFVMGIIKFFLHAITGDWDAAWGGLKQATIGVLKILKGIFYDGFMLVWETIKQVFGLIMDGLKQYIGLWSDIGKNIIQGLISGITSMASAVVSAAKNVVKGALDAAKNFLGINSPSRVMMEIGSFTSEGFAKGIQDAADMARKASENMALGSVDGLSGAMSPGAMRSAGSGMMPASSGGGITIILQFQKESLVLPGVSNGEEFVESLEGFALRQAFKSQ
jgi:TP901 family phage tail tape measure protein